MTEIRLSCRFERLMAFQSILTLAMVHCRVLFMFMSS